MSANAYLSVRVRSTRDLDTVARSYLYSHTSLLVELPNGRYVQAVLETTAQDQDTATYLAKYQAGRLQSGMYGASVYGTLGEALEDMDALR